MGFPWFFIIGIVFLLYSYILYPFLLKVIIQNRPKKTSFSSGHNKPSLSIIIAAHNEEKVLKDKLESILNSDYPEELIELLIGIDCSTDFSAIILKEYQDKFSNCELFEFDQRQGKIQIVNTLVPKASNELVILTDANVLFTPQTLTFLQAPFEDSKIGLVDTRMQHYGLKNTGISIPESEYISGEVAVKDAEGQLWGAMMGPFGGCFAFRKKCFEPIPAHFLVDDFFINMTCIKKGFQCINQKDALVLEDVSNDSFIEFKRKIRISSGNFQNLKFFWKLLFKFNWVSFTFISHKVIRWILPTFLFFMVIYIGLNNDASGLHQFLYYLLWLIPLVYCVDFMARRNKVQLIWLRYPIHFINMNVALFIGMIRFFMGIRSSIWQPTKRHQ